jgi:hypothetical protein
MEYLFVPNRWYFAVKSKIYLKNTCVLSQSILYLYRQATIRRKEILTIHHQKKVYSNRSMNKFKKTNLNSIYAQIF